MATRVDRLRDLERAYADLTDGERVRFLTRALLITREHAWDLLGAALGIETARVRAGAASERSTKRNNITV